jgi:hypothetical protein
MLLFSLILQVNKNKYNHIIEALASNFFMTTWIDLMGML